MTLRLKMDVWTVLDTSNVMVAMAAVYVLTLLSPAPTAPSAMSESGTIELSVGLSRRTSP